MSTLAAVNSGGSTTGTGPLIIRYDDNGAFPWYIRKRSIDEYCRSIACDTNYVYGGFSTGTETTVRKYSVNTGAEYLEDGFPLVIPPVTYGDVEVVYAVVDIDPDLYVNNYRLRCLSDFGITVLIDVDLTGIEIGTWELISITETHIYLRNDGPTNDVLYKFVKETLLQVISGIWPITLPTGKFYIDASENIYTIPESPYPSNVVKKYNSSGVLQWTSAGHGTFLHDIVADSSGNVYVGGEEAAYTATTRKYNSSGALQWSVNHGATVRCIYVDDSGNVYTGGDTATSNYAIRKYDSAGTVLWSEDTLGAVIDVTVDSAGNVYTSEHWDLIDGTSGRHLRKFNSSGVQQWSTKVGTVSESSVGVVLSLDETLIYGALEHNSDRSWVSVRTSDGVVTSLVTITDLTTAALFGFNTNFIFNIPTPSETPLLIRTDSVGAVYVATDKLEKYSNGIKLWSFGQYFVSVSAIDFDHWNDIYFVAKSFNGESRAYKLDTDTGVMSWSWLAPFDLTCLLVEDDGSDFFYTGAVDGGTGTKNLRKHSISGGTVEWDKRLPGDVTSIAEIYANLEIHVSVKANIEYAYNSLYVYNYAGDYVRGPTTTEAILQLAANITHLFTRAASSTREFAKKNAWTGADDTTGWPKTNVIAGFAADDPTDFVWANTSPVPGAAVLFEIPAPVLAIASGGVIAFTIPAPEIVITGTVHSSAISAVIPAPTLTMYGGATTAFEIPAPVLAAAGTVQNLARVEFEIPAPELMATGLTGLMASFAATIPAPEIQLFGGATALFEIPALELTAAGTVNALATVAFEIPALELAATGTVGSVATISIEIPALELYAGLGNRVEFEIPALILSATANPADTADETTYAINLTTGAVTQLLLGGFDKLVTAHGRLYGLKDGALTRLEGNVDGTATAIPATIRFAPQTFGSNAVKRMSDVYWSTREDDGITMDLIADERTLWRYQTLTDTAPAYGTHKIKVGRGISFHTAGLTVRNRSGGALDIGGVELLVSPLSRKPR